MSGRCCFFCVSRRCDEIEWLGNCSVAAAAGGTPGKTTHQSSMRSLSLPLLLLGLSLLLCCLGKRVNAWWHTGGGLSSSHHLHLSTPARAPPLMQQQLAAREQVPCGCVLACWSVAAPGVAVLLPKLQHQLELGSTASMWWSPSSSSHLSGAAFAQAHTNLAAQRCCSSALSTQPFHSFSRVTPSHIQLPPSPGSPGGLSGVVPTQQPARVAAQHSVQIPLSTAQTATPSPPCQVDD